MNAKVFRLSIVLFCSVVTISNIFSNCCPSCKKNKQTKTKKGNSGGSSGGTPNFVPGLGSNPKPSGIIPPSTPGKGTPGAKTTKTTTSTTTPKTGTKTTDTTEPNPDEEEPKPDAEEPNPDEEKSDSEKKFSEKTTMDITTTFTYKDGTFSIVSNLSDGTKFRPAPKKRNDDCEEKKNFSIYLDISEYINNVNTHLGDMGYTQNDNRVKVKNKFNINSNNFIIAQVENTDGKTLAIFINNVTSDEDGTTMNDLFDDFNPEEIILLRLGKEIKYLSNMFRSNTVKSISIDDNADLSNVISMKHMFYGCNNLQYIYFNNSTTKNVTNLSNMFQNCKELNRIDLDSLNFPNVTDISAMFYGCEKLIEVSFPTFTFTKQTESKDIFSGCNALQIIDFSKVAMSTEHTPEDLLDGATNSSIKVIIQPGETNATIENLLICNCPEGHEVKYTNEGGETYYAFIESVKKDEDGEEEEEEEEGEGDEYDE